MTEKEALDYLLYFDATWYVLILAFTLSTLGAFYQWLFHWRSEREMVMKELREKNQSLEAQLEHLIEMQKHTLTNH